MNKAIIDQINSIFVRDKIMTVSFQQKLDIRSKQTLKRPMTPRCTIIVISQDSTVLQAEDVREAIGFSGTCGSVARMANLKNVQAEK